MTVITLAAHSAETYVISAGFWSLLGLTGGYALGRVHCWHRRHNLKGEDCEQG